MSSMSIYVVGSMFVSIGSIIGFVNNLDQFGSTWCIAMLPQESEHQELLRSERVLAALRQAQHSLQQRQVETIRIRIRVAGKMEPDLWRHVDRGKLVKVKET